MISPVPPVVPPGPLVPIGGGYSDTFAGFVKTVVACARGKEINIVVLPTAYSSSAGTITGAERRRNLADAERRCLQLQAACRKAAVGFQCSVAVVPIFTRDDANDPAALAAFCRADAVYLLGGDQTVAMAALANTPAEDVMRRLHAEGAVVAGTSAGSGMLSAAMLAGYNPGFGAADSLHLNGAGVWNGADGRGLCFGSTGVIFDQHFFQRGRLARLLNAIMQPGSPRVGVGIDAYTGVEVSGGSLKNVFGLYVAAILDADTYCSVPLPRNLSSAGRPSAPVLSARNVLVHMLAPGGSSFDLARRRHSAAPIPPQPLGRDFSGLVLPRGAGNLFLTGNLSEDGDVFDRFYTCLPASARVLVCADGYTSPSAGRGAAEAYAAILQARGARTEIHIRTACSSAPPDPDSFDAIVLAGEDQSKVDLTQLSWVKPAWLAGRPALLDNAMAAAAGPLYSRHAPTPNCPEAAECATQRSLLYGGTQIANGLGLLSATFEPQLLADNRWGRLFSLAYLEPALVAFGLNRDSGLEITPTGTCALGTNATIALDLRGATLGLGSNKGFVIANGLLDSFAPGETVSAETPEYSKERIRALTG